MIALLHINPEGSKVLGAWVRPDESKPAQSAYRGSALEFQIGTKAVTSQPSHESWLDWCRYLAERTPVNAWWEMREVPASWSAQDVLDEEVRRQYMTAAEHKASPRITSDHSVEG